jgi:hypothetical protein
LQYDGHRYDEGDGAQGCRRRKGAQEWLLAHDVTGRGRGISS